MTIDKKLKFTLIDFVLKEWLLITSGIGLILSSIYAKQLPRISKDEFQVLFILFVLFIVVNGLFQTGLLPKIGEYIESGKFIPLKLVLATFFLSMVITNDVSLIIIVPLTLSLNINRKGILVILEALAANAGSSLTPFGNPQNLYIYWFYRLSPLKFISEIAPLSILFLIILGISSIFIKLKAKTAKANNLTKVSKISWIYLFLSLITILTILHILPVYIDLLVILFVIIFDRKTLKIDYPLLFTFLFFFGLSGNLKVIFGGEIPLTKHVFLTSALISQFISNVPAALLIAKFTHNWKALLWGANVGGFGSLFGSLANLIAFKLYISHKSTNDAKSFTTKFLILGYLSFLLSVGLYFILYKL